VEQALGIRLLGFVLLGHLGMMLEVLTAAMPRGLWAKPSTKEQGWQVGAPRHIQKQASDTASGTDTNLKQMKGRAAS